MISFGRAPCDEGVIRAAADTAGCAERARPWVLAATILGSSMAFIDGSVVTVALPAIQADLTTSAAGAQWVANAYMLMLGALILAGGSAGDRFGRRRVFALGVVIFTAASVACGLAPNTAALIAARAAQGVGGALLVPGSLAIISAAFPADERGKAIGTWAGSISRYDRPQGRVGVSHRVDEGRGRADEGCGRYGRWGSMTRPDSAWARAL